MKSFFTDPEPDNRAENPAPNGTRLPESPPPIATNMKLKLIASILVLSALPSMAASVISLPGNTESSTWTSLDSSKHTPVANTLDPWGPILDDVGSGSSISFSKVSGPAYFPTSGAGIYGYHTADSVYTITETDPIADLATLVLQARLNLRVVTVTFSYNGGSQNLLADFTSSSTAGSQIADFAWQWDLSEIEDEITSYTLTINAQSSTYIYSSSPLTIDTSDTFAQVIPEPATGFLAFGSLALAFTRRRRA